MTQYDDIEDRINRVFQTNGLPTQTYIRREKGKYDNALWDAISQAGTACVITGPSKTGKTTLYENVCQNKGLQYIRVYCDGGITAQSLFMDAASQAGMETVSQKHQEHLHSQRDLVGGRILGFGADIQNEDGHRHTQTIEPVHANPTVQQVAVFLHDKETILVIEDAHYLPIAEQRLLFQKCKSFADKCCSIIIVGAVSIVDNNRDMVGRAQEHRVGYWNETDLASIATVGFKELGIQATDRAIALVAQEAIGLPLLAQKLCRRMALNAIPQCKQPGSFKGLILDEVSAWEAFWMVANHEFAHYTRNLEDFCAKLDEESGNFFDKQCLPAFGWPSVRDSLTCSEIAHNMHVLSGAQSNPTPEDIAQVLAEVERADGKKELMVDFDPTLRRLRILDPVFHFYIRCRELNAAKMKILSLLVGA